MYEAIFSRDPGVWLPDNLFLLQEYLPHDPEHGIVRIEIVHGELLYPMRGVTHGRFNLCPAPVCNPDDGSEGACEVPQLASKPVEFYPFPEVPDEAVALTDASSPAFLPGFFQTHVHLCQTLFRGFADDMPLLDWLRRCVWPMEAAHTPASLRAAYLPLLSGALGSLEPWQRTMLGARVGPAAAAWRSVTSPSRSAAT